MSELSADEILSELKLEKISTGELRKAVRQFSRRKAKMRSKKMGHQKSWLLVSVERLTDGHFTSWLADQMRSLLDQLPNSAYKIIVAYLASEDRARDFFTEEPALQAFSVDEGFEVVAFPTGGMIAFLAPPGNLKRSLEFFGRPCEWNWPVQNEFLADGDIVDISDENQGHDLNQELLSRLHEKYGKGSGRAIALVDSGVCPKSKEFEGRTVTQILMEPTERYTVRVAPDDFEPANDHGTLTATLAAGKNYGVAPEADLVSFVVPVSKGNRFDHFAVYIALETIENDRGLVLSGPSLREKVDTILLPIGLFPKNKVKKEFREASVEPLIESLNRDCNISIVAAIGNKPEKIAFPAEHTSVHAVGSLGLDGTRHARCGYGSDQNGEALPNSFVCGVDLVSVGRENSVKVVTGSSFAASVVAGYFTLLSSKYDTSRARATRMHSAIEVSTDKKGAIKRLNPESLL